MIIKRDGYWLRVSLDYMRGHVPPGEKHVELVHIEGWWLLGVVPLYVRHTVLSKVPERKFYDLAVRD